MRINGRTQLYGLIGYPVRHTLSPLMHNAAFAALGINAVYLPFEVKPAGLKSAIQSMKTIGVMGVNVTIPHKEKVLDYIDVVDKEAALIKAVNTVVAKKGKLYGFNTDGRGFVSSLKEGFGITPKGKHFFIIGAGGVSRAISFSLAIRGAGRIVLVDEVRKKAINLARSLARNTPCEAIALRKGEKAARDLILNSGVLINASPCGMKQSDPIPISPSFLYRGLFVYDVIYKSEGTKLLRYAKEKGARVLNGTAMLLDQGAISFNLWTGKNPPVHVMKKALTSYRF